MKKATLYDKGFLRQGFTLIELLVVIAIIGLLSTIVVASLSNVRAKGRFTNAISTMEELRKAADIYYLNHNAYPPNYIGEGDPGFVTDGLIPIWPKATCPGWYYDWDYWDHNGSYDATELIVRITLRKADNTPVYFFCVYADGDCLGGGVAAGTNIQTVSPGTTLACS